MSEFTIGELIRQVPEGHKRVFERSIAEPGEERFFRVWQNWDYRPGRLEWRNSPSLESAPWNGTREKPRNPVSTLPPPDVRFKGPSKDVVDFYSTGSHAFFISDRLFRMIEEQDPDSLDHLGFELRAKEGSLPFHAVMPHRALEAIDTRRTTVGIEVEDLGGWYFRKVQFPDGIAFNHEALLDVASFSDIDAPGWYWSMDLIHLAKSQGIRGLFAKTVSSATAQDVARL